MRLTMQYASVENCAAEAFIYLARTMHDARCTMHEHLIVYADVCMDAINNFS